MNKQLDPIKETFTAFVEKHLFISACFYKRQELNSNLKAMLDNMEAKNYYIVNDFSINTPSHLDKGLFKTIVHLEKDSVTYHINMTYSNHGVEIKFSESQNLMV
jgi:hypothetical protein